jgi:hypothetical protein
MNSARKGKIRSFIFDVPTRSHLVSPYDEEELFVGKNRLSPPISRFGDSKAPSRSNSMLPEESTHDISDEMLKFYMDFLPYVYAQSGYSRLRTLLNCFKQRNTTESLPLGRKSGEVDIFAEEQKSPNQVIARNRSMEVVKSKFN